MAHCILGDIHMAVATVNDSTPTAFAPRKPPLQDIHSRDQAYPPEPPHHILFIYFTPARFVVLVRSHPFYQRWPNKHNLPPQRDQMKILMVKRCFDMLSGPATVRYVRVVSHSIATSLLHVSGTELTCLKISSSSDYLHPCPLVPTT